MIDFVVGAVLGALAGFMFAALIAGDVYDSADKAACEEHLPRDVECTWQPPQDKGHE